MKYDIDIHDALQFIKLSPPPNIIPVEGIGKEVMLKNGRTLHTAKLPGTHAHRITWKQFQDRMITREEYYQLFRVDDPFDAVGIISGVNGWRCWDFDKCPSSSPIYELLDILNLPEDYEWVVESGSHNGFHVWFRSGALPANHGLPSKRKDAGVYSGKGIGFDHLELRYNHCQTLIPPSIHPTLNRYEFLHDAPTDPPAYLEAEQIIDAFFEMTLATPIVRVAQHNTHKDTNTAFSQLITQVNPLDVFEALGWEYAEDSANYIGECPKHDSVSGTCLRWHIADGFYKCFHDSCGEAGDIISFVALFLDCKPYDAALWCAQRFVPELQGLFRFEPPHPAKGGEKV